jgi:hypothetical protein
MIEANRPDKVVAFLAVVQELLDVVRKPHPRANHCHEHDPTSLLTSGIVTAC